MNIFSEFYMFNRIGLNRFAVVFSPDLIYNVKALNL
jgi:hypothetical protein